MISSKVESSIDHICNAISRDLDDIDNFNLTEFGDTMMKLTIQGQRVEDAINEGQS